MTDGNEVVGSYTNRTGKLLRENASPVIVAVNENFSPTLKTFFSKSTSRGKPFSLKDVFWLNIRADTVKMTMKHTTATIFIYTLFFFIFSSFFF